MANARIRGLTIEISADNRPFIDSFKKINAAVRETSNQLKDVDKLLKLDPGNVDLLTQKQKLLNASIDDVTKRLVLEKAELARLKDADQTPEVVKEQEALQRQIAADESELKSLQKELKDFGSIGKQQALAVASSFEEAGEKISAVGEKLTSTGRTLSKTVTAPIVGVGTAAVKTAADFDSSMSKVQAVSGATSEEMDKLRKTALEYASKTSFTAEETGEALYYMGLAGWKSEQMMAGLPGILNLAAASGEDLGAVSDIVTDALTAFGLGAEDAAEFVDVLAAASSNSNTTVAMLGESFKYVAPVAGSLGYSIQDVSLALGVMANNGIKGSQAGASLRNILSRMSKPTKEVQEAMSLLGISLTDGNGEMLSMGELLNELRDAFGESEMPIEEFTSQVNILDSQLEEGTITQEEYDASLEKVAVSAYGVEGAEKAKLAAMLGGQRSMASILALVNTTTEDYNKLSAAIDNSAGSAQKMADTMLDNLGGQLTILKSQIEGAAIQIGGILIPYVSDIVSKIQEWVTAFSELDEGTKETIVQIAALVAAIGPALIIAGSVTSAIGSITGAIGGLIAFVVGNPIAAAVIGLTVALGAAAVAVALFGDDVDILTEKERELKRIAEEMANGYDEARDARVKNNRSIQDSFGILDEEWERLQDIVDETGHVKEGYEEEAEYLVNHLNEALGTNIELKDGQIKKYAILKESVEELIQTKMAEALLMANEEDYIEALKTQHDLVDQLTEAQVAKKEREQELAELEAERAEMIEKFPNIEHDAYSASASDQNQVLAQYRKLEAKIWDVEGALEQDKATLESLSRTYGKNQSTIKNYTDVQRALADGSLDLGEAMMNLTYDLQRAGEASEDELVKQYNDYVKHFNDMLEASREKGSAITSSMVKEAAQMVLLSENELKKGAIWFNSTGATNAQKYLDGFNSKQNEVKQSGTKLVTETAASMDSQRDRFGRAGQNATATYDQGLLKNANTTYAAGRNRANQGATGAGSVDYSTPGKRQAQQYDSSISADINNTRNAGQKRGTAGKEGAGSVDYAPTGRNQARQYDSSISADINNARTAGQQRANAGKEGAGSVDYGSTGRSQAKQFDAGILDDIENTKAAAKKLPESAKAEIEKYSLKQTGRDFASGFKIGIAEETENITNASSSVARKARDTVKAVLGVNSPSKVMQEIGKWFDMGFVVGIEDNEKKVQEAAAEMAMGATAAMNIGAAGALQSGGTTNNATYGDVHITVNGAEGQDINALADVIEDRMYRAYSRKQAVFA